MARYHQEIVILLQLEWFVFNVPPFFACISITFTFIFSRDIIYLFRPTVSICFYCKCLPFNVRYLEQWNRKSEDIHLYVFCIEPRNFTKMFIYAMEPFTEIPTMAAILTQILEEALIQGNIKLNFFGFNRFVKFGTKT